MGGDNDPDHISAKVIRLTQDSSHNLAVNSWVKARGANDLAGMGTGAFFYALDANHDPNYVWAVGWTVHGSGLDTGDVLLAKILKNNGSNVMEFTKLYRITTSYDTSFRGSGVIVDDKYVYISTWHLPHAANLATNEPYHVHGNMAYILKLDKAVLEGESPASALIWAKGFDGATAATYHTGITHLRDGGDGFLYAGMITNAFGKETYRGPAVLKIFKETGRSTDYQDATPKFRERARNSDITIADVLSTFTKDAGTTAILTEAGNTTTGTPVWDATVITPLNSHRHLNVPQ